MKSYGGSCVPWLLCLAACGSTPPIRIYLLTPPLQSAASEPSPVVPVDRIVMSRVRVPDYLDTTDILLRDGTRAVKVSETGRWGERLSHALTRALAADLGARLPGALDTFDPSSTQRQVQVNVDALDLWPDGRCAMTATWTIVDPAAPRAVANGTGRFAAAPDGSSPDGADGRLVDSMAHAVGALADAIAASIRQGSVSPVAQAP
jgi:uncharacterized lipoprotein YmbA